MPWRTRGSGAKPPSPLDPTAPLATGSVPKESAVLSIRARLTLWYAATFGVLLGVVGVASYLALAGITQRDADSFLSGTAEAVGASLQLALSSVPPALSADTTAVPWAVARTLDNHRLRDIGVALFRASATPGDGAPQLLAVDSTSTATRDFGGVVGWRSASVAVSRALARGGVDLMTLLPQRERVVALPVRTRRGTFVVAVSQSLEVHDTVLRRVRQVMLVGIPLSLLLAMLGGYALAAASLRPVEAMRVTASGITARNLHERLPVSRPSDELARLSQTFNELLDRVEDAFAQRRRFTADASHELRTPVAIVIGESELALSADRTTTEYRAALQVIHGEARRLALIVADLFLLARADAAEQTLNPGSHFLEELVGDCVDAMGTIARARDIHLAYSPESEVPWTGDGMLLRRMLMNLLDNAIKYTPKGGIVQASVEPREGGGAIVRVTDSGPGIPEAHQARIFERFYRVQHNDVRSDVADTSGAGLGLPIAAWIVRAHGGTLRLARSDASGSTFEIELPG